MKRWLRLMIVFGCMSGAMGSVLFDDFTCFATPWGVFGVSDDFDDDDFFDDVEDFFDDLFD